MNDFLKELPALIITLAVLIMATLLLLLGHVAIEYIVAIVSPVIGFWFLGKAYSWQPPQSAGQPTPVGPGEQRGV